MEHMYDHTIVLPLGIRNEGNVCDFQREYQPAGRPLPSKAQFSYYTAYGIPNAVGFGHML